MQQNKSKYLINARKIKQWMEERKTTKPPAASSKDIEEKKLGCALGAIRSNNIKKYKQLKTDEERQQYLRIHPGLDETIEIVNWIDENNISKYLVNARQIKQWMEERKTTKPPTIISEDKEEKRLGCALSTIRRDIIKTYKELKTEEEIKGFRKKHPGLDEIMEIVHWIDKNRLSAYLVNARDIKRWMEDRKTIRPPSINSKDKEEKRLHYALNSIKKDLIKPYKELKTEKERKEFRKKHPGLDEIMEIVNWIDENNISQYLVNIREIKQWMEERDTTKPPTSFSKDPEEKKLGFALINIRHHLIKPYLELETEEQKSSYLKRHPETEQVLKIVRNIDENNSQYLRNMKEIVYWTKSQEGNMLPNRDSKNKKEAKLAIALQTITRFLVKPYINIQTEEEMSKYREKYPEIEEVLALYSKLYLNNGNKNQRALAALIQKDLKKRKSLEMAKQLEASYENAIEDKNINLGEKENE